MRVPFKAMKHYIIIALLLISIRGVAQDDKTLYVAKYKYSVIADTNNRNNVYLENMMLLIGKNSSLFKSYDAYVKDSLVMAQQTVNMNVFANARQFTDDQILNVYNSPTGYVSKKIGLRYFWENPMPKYDWQISSEIKTIAGFKCQKATMFSSRTGKSYIAWFTAEIPVPTGPSYMHGLPGLIVKFEDTGKTVLMELYAFGSNTKGNELVSFGKRSVKTTKADFDKALAAYKNDPMGFLRSTGALSGSVDQSSVNEKN